MAQQYRVEARPAGRGWWTIRVPEVTGALSQARRLDRVEAMAQEAIALVLEVDEAEVAVGVEVVLPEKAREALNEALLAKEQARSAELAAAEQWTEAARQLTGEGLSMRDVGVVMGVSHQRVAQLLAG